MHQKVVKKGGRKMRNAMRKRNENLHRTTVKIFFFLHRITILAVGIPGRCQTMVGGQERSSGLDQITALFILPFNKAGK
jgi:hypothetical protein